MSNDTSRQDFAGGYKKFHELTDLQRRAVSGPGAVLEGLSQTALENVEFEPLEYDFSTRRVFLSLNQGPQASTGTSPSIHVIASGNWSVVYRFSIDHMNWEVLRAAGYQIPENPAQEFGESQHFVRIVIYQSPFAVGETEAFFKDFENYRRYHQIMEQRSKRSDLTPDSTNPPSGEDGIIASVPRLHMKMQIAEVALHKSSPTGQLIAIHGYFGNGGLLEEYPTILIGNLFAMETAKKVLCGDQMGLDIIWLKNQIIRLKAELEAAKHNYQAQITSAKIPIRSNFTNNKNRRNPARRQQLSQDKELRVKGLQEILEKWIATQKAGFKSLAALEREWLEQNRDRIEEKQTKRIFSSGGSSTSDLNAFIGFAPVGLFNLESLSSMFSLIQQSDREKLGIGDEEMLKKLIKLGNTGDISGTVRGNSELLKFKGMRVTPCYIREFDDSTFTFTWTPGNRKGPYKIFLDEIVAGNLDLQI